MPAELAPMVWANRRLTWGQKTYVMGIVNVTPDSFSGDGLLNEPQSEATDEVVRRVVEQAKAFVAEGATFIDVGGESCGRRAGNDQTGESQLTLPMTVRETFAPHEPSSLDVSSQ